MNNFIRSSVLILTTFALMGCEMGYCIKGEGESTRTFLPVEPFQHLVLKGSFDARIAQGPVQQIEVEGQANLAEMITTEVLNGTWTVSISECYRAGKPFLIHVTVPEIKAITIRGSGDITSVGTLVADTLLLTIQGSGDLDLNVQAQHVKATVQGSGDLRLAGTANKLDTRIQGSGDVDALELTANDVKAAIMGSGDISVNCTALLDATVMGSGDIRYLGKPLEVVKTIKGSGTIRNEQ